MTPFCGVKNLEGNGSRSQRENLTSALACVESISGAVARSPVSRSRSSNRTGGFPASRLSDKGSFSICPRQVSAKMLQSEQPQLLVEVLIPEAISTLSLDLVLVT